MKQKDKAMRQFLLLLTVTAFVPAWAQPAPVMQPALQPADSAQRRADLRHMLQQRQDAKAVQRQLNAQERADLREALRQQRQRDIRSAQGKP